MKTRGHKTTKFKRRKEPTATRRHASVADGGEIKVTRLARELLEQQKATLEVLAVISRFPTDLEPVLQAVLENAVRLCGAKFGALYLSEGDAFRIVAMHNAPPRFTEMRRRNPVFLADPRMALARAAATKHPVQIADVQAEPGYFDPLPGFSSSQIATLAGGRTVVAVPLLKESKLVGAIGIYRREVRPFTDRQIELLTSFANQAVIAIENTRLLNELRQRTDDLGEALKQQTATSEVLQVISSSPGELQPVFQSMLVNATRLCEANFGSLYLCERDTFRIAEMHNAPPAYKELRRSEPVIDSAHPAVKAILGRLANTKEIVQITDLTVAPPVERGALASLAGARSVLAVPMLKENELIGALIIYRQEVRPFTDKQIALLTNFASQAVIAIENARLLNDLRQRTSELTESLEQQTATSEVLRVISSSPGELQPVFQTMLVNAVRLCEAKFGNLFLHEGGTLRIVASHDVPGEFVEARRRRGSYQGTPLGDVVGTKQTVHMPDLAATQAYAERHPAVVEAVELGGIRTVVLVPMLKDNELVGVIAIYRQEVRPFTDRQISLVQNFAAQAVIAIENARLLSELRESLQQQTATSQVLQVISTSPGELAPVFQAILENATHICEAKFGNLLLYEGEFFRVAAMHGAAAAWEELRRRHPLLPAAGKHPLARVVATRQVQHIADFKLEEGYVEGEPGPVALVQAAGARTVLVVPMLKQDELLGAIAIYRQEVLPFTGKQIALVQNFASQAVIAIENARLLSELRQRTEDLSESLQQQTAASEVLQVISRSAFDLQPVFEAVAESSLRLCGADRAFIFRFDGELLRMVAAYNAPPEFKEWVAKHPIRPGRHSGSARAALERRTIHIPDVRADLEYTYGAKDAEAIRTVLGVPILKGDDLLGVMMIYHLQGVRPFTEKQIALVETFADQAAIAIENVRLFQEIQEKSRQLAEASQHKSQFLANMSHELRTPLNAIIGVTEMLREDAEAAKQDLEPLDRVLGAARHLLALINDILDLSKIEAGRMELALTSFALAPLIADVVKTVEPLAAKSFNKVAVHCNPRIEKVQADQMRLRQALLNLMSNANKFTERGTISVDARQGQENGRDWIMIAVADTGIGMTLEQMGKLFQEFSQASSTTASKYGGTGLGLAISRRFCQMMGGDITVESEPGRGSTFTIWLPRIVDAPAVASAHTGEAALKPH
jgi:GAF domain-containing protein